MVWEDTKHGNLEILYASLTGDSVSPEVRISNSTSESSYPCVAYDSQGVHVLWQEFTGKVFDVYYVRLIDGEEVARSRITSSSFDSSCPVSVVGPDKALHIAWHEGPYKQTAVYYGRIIADSLVEKQPVCTEHPEAFRPDIACDDKGRLLIAWFEGLEVKSRFWDGTAWGEETLVATNEARSWRLSLVNLEGDEWALAWFDNTNKGSNVFVKFFDGNRWHSQVTLNNARMSYYPGMISLPGGELAVAWEGQDIGLGQYSLQLKYFNGKAWSEQAEIYRERYAGRYISLYPYENELHAVWFSATAGNDEIYHGLLRRK
jgi:hypothetical protein